MTELSALWLPILLGAVVCFIASSIIHMTAALAQERIPAVARRKEGACRDRRAERAAGRLHVAALQGMKEIRHRGIQGEAATGA